ASTVISHLSLHDALPILSAPVSEHGGRHPLPDMKQFKGEIEKVGIDRSKTVIAYDGGEGQFASRFWWLLTYLGHDKVYVLNEGRSEEHTSELQSRENLVC